MRRPPQSLNIGLYFPIYCGPVKVGLTSATPSAIDEMPFPNLIRTGNEQGLLLNNWERWKDFRQARNISSHTYDESKAMQVMEILPDFLLEAQALLRELKKRNNPET